MYMLMNCTPHPINLLQDALDGRDTLTITAIGHRRPATRLTPAGETLVIIEPGGRRLACDPATRGPAIGCQVTYRLSEGARDELPGIFASFESVLGVGMIVIASESTVHALAGQLYDPSGGLPIVAVWPVFATASLRLPMPDRWADHLATPHKSVRNDAGEIVDEIPLHRALPRLAA